MRRKPDKLYEFNSKALRRRHFLTLILAIVINWLLWGLINIPVYYQLSKDALVSELFEDLWQTAVETIVLMELSILFSKLLLLTLWRTNQSFAYLLFQCMALMIFVFSSAAITARIYSSIYPEMGGYEALYRVMLCDGITVYFVSSVYYVSHLFSRFHKEHELVEITQKQHLLDKTRIMQNRLDTLALQSNNHFIFNSFSTLKTMIEEDSAQAPIFLQNLADVYRYFTRAADARVVRIDEELAFTRSFIHLIRYRYDNIKFSFDLELQSAQGYVPPISVQQLVENAVKHNRHGKADGLCIRITLKSKYIVVTNNILPMTGIEIPSRIGLSNLCERYNLISDKELLVENDGELFQVSLPILSNNDIKDESCNN